MKKIIFLAVFIIATVNIVSAQGISFDSTSNWKEIVTKAKAEKRLIYADIYTTWCGPCKVLVQQVFPQKKVGDKYNALFVNCRIDAEKGEGIALAKKYGVNGYPTHLFIDPATEKLVYTHTGATTNLDNFNSAADVALEEYKDPMTWEKYSAKFQQGQRDSIFLRDYLYKAQRLDKNNDAILNAYITSLGADKITPKQLNFIFNEVQTLDNDAIALICARKTEINIKYPDEKDHVLAYLERWAYPTFEKAVNDKNIKLIDKIAATNKKYSPETDEQEIYWYKTNYYQKTGDDKNIGKAATEQGNYLMSIPAAKYLAEDKAKEEETINNLRQMLVFIKVPEEKIEEGVKKNLAKNPSRLHPSSTSAASALNGNAWWVYENHPGDKELMKEAFKWSAYSLTLSEQSADEYPMFADTYAHLLFVSGDKDKAIQVQTDAVARAKQVPDGDAEVKELEESLQKMKAGSL